MEVFEVPHLLARPEVIAYTRCKSNPNLTKHLRQES